jgi:hypothetical protein
MNAKTFLKTTLLTSTLMYAAHSAQAQAPLLTSRIPAANLEKAYRVPVRQPIVNPNLNLLPSQLQDVERQLNSQGFTLTRPDDTWTAVPNLDESKLAAQVQAYGQPGSVSITKGTSGSGNLGKMSPLISKLPPGIIYNPIITVTDTFNKSWEAGDPSSFWAQAALNVTHTANRTMAQIQAQGRVDGAVLGSTHNLGLATANVQSPASGNQTVSMGLSVMGDTVWSANQSGSNLLVSKGYNWNGTLWKTGFDFTIDGYGLTADLWVQGSVGATFAGSSAPLYAFVGGDVNAAVSVGGTVSADLYIIAGKLQAQLTLASADLSGYASTQVVNNEMVARRVLQADLNFLSGQVYAQASSFGEVLGTYYFWNHPNGYFSYDNVIANTTDTIPFSVTVGAAQ